MQVGFNVSPLCTGHKFRGIGYYTKHLLNYLEKEEDIEVKKFLKQSEVKDVHLVHYPWFDLYFHTLPVFKSFPTVITIHDVIPLVFPKQYPVGFKGKINLYLQKIALKSCRYIITDSQRSKNDILKYLGVKEEKIIVIPLAADPVFKIFADQDLIRIKRKFNLPDKFLLYVGDANWVKNLPFLIEGFRQIIKKSEFNNTKLVLAGGVFLKNVENIDHPELASLKRLNRMIREYKLENDIIRPGHIDDNELAAIYNLATVYIQPSLYEGFGLPLLQAFACGTPVISSDGGSLSEVGGKAAIYFNPKDLNQFVSILTDVLQDKSLRYKLTRAGFDQVNKFSWKKTVARTIAVYHQALINN